MEKIYIKQVSCNEFKRFIIINSVFARNDRYLKKESETMADYLIELPTIGEILKEEFMEPLGVSSYKLAKEINVPVSRIQEILKDRRKITQYGKKFRYALGCAHLAGIADPYRQSAV